MLRIGLCDDESAARDALRFALQKLLREDEPLFYEFSRGEGVLRWLEKHSHELDVLFLDVEMGALNGLETARRIRSVDSQLQLVFVTGYSDYVFDGYAVQALDYLLKPIQLPRLAQVVQRLQQTLAAQQEHCFLIKNSDGLFRVPQDDLLYLFSDRRQVTAITTRQQLTFYGKLDDVQRELGAGFVRIHQRYLVRAAAVSHIGAEQVEINGTTLPVSRALKQEALMQLARCLTTGEHDD